MVHKISEANNNPFSHDFYNGISVPVHSFAIKTIRPQNTRFFSQRRREKCLNGQLYVGAFHNRSFQVPYTFDVEDSSPYLYIDYFIFR